jgi:uncharacterized membrane protein
MIEVLFGLLAAMGTAIVLLLKSRSNQKDRADKAEQQAEDTKKVLDHVEIRKQIERDNVGSDVDRLLRDKWTRD